MPAQTEIKCMQFKRSHAWFRTGTHDSQLDVMIDAAMPKSAADPACVPASPVTSDAFAISELPNVILLHVLAVQVMPWSHHLSCQALFLSLSLVDSFLLRQHHTLCSK